MLRRIADARECRWLVLTMLGLLLASAPLAAEEGGTAIGRVIALRGAATAIASDGRSRALTLATTIDRGERVRTTDRCRLQILFRDNTIISLGPRSELVVEEYQWDGDQAPAKMKSVIREGVFRVLGGSITRSAPENFTTETPNATIGIRGSMYAGTVREGVLQVVFQGGKGIFVRNPVHSVEISTPGFGTRVTARDVAPTEPYRVPAAELEQLDPLQASAPQSVTEESSPEPEETAAQEDTTAQPAEEAPAEAVATTAEGSAGPATGEEPAAGSSPTDPGSGEPITEPIAEAVAEALPVTEALPATTADPPVTGSTLPVLAGVTDLTSQASSGASDSLLQTQVSGATSTPTTTVPSQSLSGRFMAVQDDLTLASTAGDLVWTGTLTGSSRGASFTGQVVTGQGTLTLDPLPVHPFDASLSYSGATKLTGQTRSVSLLGQPVTFTSLDVASDAGGEFNVFVLDDLFSTPSHAYHELGFAGVASLTRPTTGIDSYRGPLLLTLKDLVAPDFEGFNYELEARVNWHNGKVLGIIRAPGLSPGIPDEVNGFFFGDLNGTGLSNVQFIGMDIVGPDPVPTPGMMPLTINGTTSFSQFYGSQTQGLGLVAGGNTYDVLSQAAQESWQFTAAGYREAGLTKTSRTGSATWQGFAVGIGDDMTAPDVNRRIFMNTVPSDFTLTVDRDAGSVSGTLNASNHAGATVLLSGLQIGGASGSAYIDDQLIAARIGSSGSVVNGAQSGNLKNQGNYLISEDPSTPLASYVSWGNWEIAYDDPATLHPYHVHNPGTYWVAGERTPATEVQSLIASNFSATYNGAAAGVLIPASGSFNQLTNGTSSLLIDFSPGASFPVSGTLAFTEATLNVFSSPGSLTSAGFTGQISGATQGALQGAFYGPGAASIGGSFDALMSTGESYTGVFGGDR